MYFDMLMQAAVGLSMKLWCPFPNITSPKKVFQRSFSTEKKTTAQRGNVDIFTQLDTGHAALFSKLASLR